MEFFPIFCPRYWPCLKIINMRLFFLSHNIVRKKKKKKKLIIDFYNIQSAILENTNKLLQTDLFNSISTLTTIPTTPTLTASRFCWGCHKKFLSVGVTERRIQPEGMEGGRVVSRPIKEKGTVCNSYLSFFFPPKKEPVIPKHFLTHLPLFRLFFYFLVDMLIIPLV